MDNYYVWFDTITYFDNKMKIEKQTAYMVSTHKINDNIIVCLNNEIKARAIMYLLNYFKFGYQYKIDYNFTEELYKEVINDYPELFAV